MLAPEINTSRSTTLWVSSLKHLIFHILMIRSVLTNRLWWQQCRWTNSAHLQMRYRRIHAVWNIRIYVCGPLFPSQSAMVHSHGHPIGVDSDINARLGLFRQSQKVKSVLRFIRIWWPRFSRVIREKARHVSSSMVPMRSTCISSVRSGECAS